MNFKSKHILAGLGLLAVLGASGMFSLSPYPHLSTAASVSGGVGEDTTYSEDGLYPQPRQGVVYADIKVLARSYADSIVVRWVGEDYVTQDYLYKYGVDIIRETRNDSTGVHRDTLVSGFKPWSRQQFMDYYPQIDSLAYMGIGLLYNDMELTPDQTKSSPGTMGALIDISDDQNMRTGFSLLVSEWRPDLADRMAMRWVDRNVEVGRVYEYFVMPTKFDTTMTFPVRTGHTDLMCLPHVREEFNVACGDSIVGPHKVRLWWQNRNYSSYEVERRRVDGDTTEWKRITNTPIVVMENETRQGTLQDCYRGDVIDEVGNYEYRIFAHDAFGDLTLPSPVIKVTMPDLDPPSSPELTYVEIDRKDPNDLSKQVMCTFHFHKDQLEPDYAGMHLYYYNERITQNNWKKLNQLMIGRTDTTYTVDMTGFGSGMVVVAAVDTAGNMNYSMPRMVQIKDMRPPRMLKNFSAHTNRENGEILLTWEPDSLDDDIEYYELVGANDTTHTFVQVHKGKLYDAHYTDTVAMDVNQKYIYYKVRAIDYSTNEGQYTAPLQVVRPSILVPNVAHLLDSKVDSLGIHMVWGCSNEQIMDRHVLLRRLQGSEKWDTLGVFSADSIKAQHDRLHYTDTPVPNRALQYQYAVESFSCFDVSSGLSLVSGFNYRGSRFVKAELQLDGRFDADKKLTMLNWSCSYPESQDWYYCLYREGIDDAEPKFFMSLPSSQRELKSSLLSPGEMESFYIKMRFRDGRESSASNTVSVQAPEK